MHDGAASEGEETDDYYLETEEEEGVYDSKRVLAKH
jgi:hypothetical protein